MTSLPDFRAAEVEWQRRGGNLRASELVSAAIIADSRSAPTAISAALSLAADRDATAMQRYVAGEVLSHEEVPEAPDLSADEFVDAAAVAVRRVRRLRSRLRNYPRNALTWTDLAREYLVLAQDERARRALETARGLDAGNRLVARSAALFYSSTGDPERAEFVLRDGPDPTDPWIMSARVAIGRRGSGISVRGVRRVVKEGDFDPWHVGELAAGLATWELESGNDRIGRQLMRRALIDPTENVLAQAEWARASGFDNVAFEELSAAREPYEARARRYMAECMWEQAASSAAQWLVDQPFSTDAAATASYCAVEAGQFRFADSILTAALFSNPGDAILLNNRAYARACMWDLTGAEEDLDSVVLVGLEAQNYGCLLATTGLVLFRRGEVERGHRMYERSIRMLLEANLPGPAARSAVNLVAEELRLKTPEVLESYKRAAALVARAADPSASDAWRRLVTGVGLGESSAPSSAS